MSVDTATERIHEPALLQWLRWRLVCNNLGLILQKSFLRFLTILVSCLLIWATLFIIGYVGFRELYYTWNLPLDGNLILLIFNLSFVALSLLLVFSTGIILFSSLFSSRESAFLLVTPISPDHIFAYKFQGALAFSSWAFVLLASPLFLAYGLVVPGGAPWYYYLFVPLFFFGFILLPGSVGALICLLLVNFFPRHRKQLLILFTGLLVFGVAWWVYSRLWPSAREIWLRGNALVEILGEFSLVQGWFLPAQWTAEGFRAAAFREPVTALYYLALIWSNGLLFYLGITWLAGKLYRRGHNLLASWGGNRRVYRQIWLDRLFSGMVGFLDGQTRTLVEKDFRSFRRDPAQWAQILIFLGLVVLIFGNIRTYYFQEMARPFKYGISLLNITATGFLMCAYSGRFVFPMLSLEGRKFWILGLLPLDRRKLLWSKFYFSLLCILLMGEFLVNLSNLVLGMPWEIMVVHSLAVAFLAVGMSGLSVGMGATMPNFRESDPSKIAVGFGGTIMLITGLLFELALVAVMVLPWHLTQALGDNPQARVMISQRWLWLGLAGGLLLGTLAMFLPMRAGEKALKKMEF